MIRIVLAFTTVVTIAVSVCTATAQQDPNRCA
jgi:hypothetical protein